MYQLAFTLLKRFWPFLVGALLLFFIWRWHVGEVKDAYKDAYKEGVRVTEEYQAEVIAKRMLENEKREQRIALEVIRLETQLEGKTRENELLATDLSRVASQSRLCLADQVRRRTVPSDPGTTSSGNGPAIDPGPPETLGSAVTELFHACQTATDELIVLQSWAKEIRR